MKLPIGIEHFEDLRRDGNVYVDKTEYIYRLMQGAKYQFFARPRRFGKSLMLTTLKAAYEGKKELFEGLWLEHHYHFESRPVLHINFSLLSGIDLQQSLLDFFAEEAEKRKIPLHVSNIRDTFRRLIESLGQDKPVVLLVDEYDKPLVDYLGPEQSRLRETNQEILRQLYGTLKGLGAYLHMVLLTGVSKFGKLNLFSDLNNVQDISLHKNFTLMCGYTKKELQAYFADHHKLAQQKLGLSPEKYWEALQFWYNGYSWDGVNTLYCPYSTLLFLDNPNFIGYWYATGTPTFLIKMIEQWKYTPFELESFDISDTDVLSTANVDNMNAISIMFQTGYLTIKSIQDDDGIQEYHLGYPNEEVRQAFSKNLLQNYLHDHRLINTLGKKLRHTLRQNKWDEFFEHVNTAFADVPYDVFEKKESYFNSLMHLMLIFSELYTLGQVHTNTGRIDNVVEHRGSVYIFEYKMDGSAKAALQQIKDKHYAQKFSGKDITLIGVNFSSELKQASEWLVEHMQHIP